MHRYRTHTCGELRKRHTGQTIHLSGWLHRKRDHGGILFLDLRDHYGLTQLVLHPGECRASPTVEPSLRAESRHQAWYGEVVARERLAW